MIITEKKSELIQINSPDGNLMTGRFAFTCHRLSGDKELAEFTEYLATGPEVILINSKYAITRMFQKSEIDIPTPLELGKK